MGRARAAACQGSNAILDFDIVLDRAAVIAASKPGSTTLVIPEDAQVANPGKAQGIAVFRGHWIGITHIVGKALEAGNNVELSRFSRLVGPQAIYDCRIDRLDKAGPVRHHAYTDAERRRRRILAAPCCSFLDVAHALKLIGENKIYAVSASLKSPDLILALGCTQPDTLKDAINMALTEKRPRTRFKELPPTIQSTARVPR